MAASETTWSSVPIDGGGVANLGAGGQGDSLVVWATSSAGLYRSTDGGRTWTRSQAPSPRATIAGIDPRDGNRAFVMFLRPEFGGPAPNGLFFTTDGGATWSRAGLPGLVFVYQVAFDPSDEDVLFAATSNGLRRSEDGGQTWSPAGSFTANIFAVAVAPDDPQIVLASTLDKVFRSADGGATFTEVFGSGMAVLVFDPSHPGRVYGTFGTIYRSDDHGLTWEEIGRPFGANHYALAVDEEGTLYAGSVLGVIRSTNQGATFTPPATPAHHSPDDTISSLVALPNGDVLASGYRGVWRLADGEQTWRPSSRGIRALDIVGLAVTADGRVLASVPRNGVFRSDNGRNFRVSAQGLRVQFEVPGLKLVPAPSDADVVYGSDAYTFFRSDDGGVSWHELTVPNVGQLVRILAVDPTDPDVIYAGGPEYNPRDDYGKCHALRSRDGGDTWTCVEGDDIYQLSAVVIDPRQPRRLYALDGSQFKISEDQGTNWQASGHGIPGDQGLAPTLARDNRGRLFVVTYEGQVYRSVDGGASFAPVGSGLPNALVIELIADPRRANTLYAFVERQGVFRSRNGGRTWQRLGTGLPAAQFTGVAELDVERGILWAGTQGRGLYRIDVP